MIFLCLGMIFEMLGLDRHLWVLPRVRQKVFHLKPIFYSATLKNQINASLIFDIHLEAGCDLRIFCVRVSILCIWGLAFENSSYNFILARCGSLQS